MSTRAPARPAVLRQLRRRTRLIRARSRLRAANLRRTQRAIGRRPDSGPPLAAAPVVEGETAWGAPRTLLWVSVKRDNPTLRDLYVDLLSRSGSWTRDAQHGQGAAHSFHPVLVEPISDQEVAARLRTFAHGYDGAWRSAWTRRSQHDTCRTFQERLLAAAGLVEEVQHLASRGSGCPFLYRRRTALWRVQDWLEARRERRGERPC